MSLLQSIDCVTQMGESWANISSRWKVDSSDNHHHQLSWQIEASTNNHHCFNVRGAVGDYDLAVLATVIVTTVPLRCSYRSLCFYNGGERCSLLAALPHLVSVGEARFQWWSTHSSHGWWSLWWDLAPFPWCSRWCTLHWLGRCWDVGFWVAVSLAWLAGLLDNSASACIPCMASGACWGWPQSMENPWV